MTERDTGKARYGKQAELHWIIIRQTSCKSTFNLLHFRYDKRYTGDLIYDTGKQRRHQLVVEGKIYEL